MIKQIKFKVNLANGRRVNASMGSLLHGALMERLVPAYAQRLHEQNLRPFSQAIYFAKEKGYAVWQVEMLNDEFIQAFSRAVMGVAGLNLRQKDAALELELLDEHETSFTALADEIFLADSAPRGVKLDFVTPTSFKQNGYYIVFPSTEILLNSLLSRWNSFTDGMKLEEDNLKNKLGNMCHIAQYNMHSARFSLESMSITGFAGTMGIRFHGNDMQRRLLGLLFRFAPYAGLGIKTALGMGCVTSELQY